MSADLGQLFESLVLPLQEPAAHNLSAIVIPESESHRLAKDSNGSPCLLLHNPVAGSRLVPIRLQNLMVSYDVPCTITHQNGKREQGNFTIVRCSNSDPKLFPYFLRIISPIVITLGPAPTAAAVRRAISGLVELFQALSVPAKKSIQGLWAELFLIGRSTNPSDVAAAWHRMPEEHFDFVAGRQRLEVKSSSTRRREHHFSLAQLRPPGESRVVVASLFVERVGGGVSLRQLFDEIRTRLVSQPALVTELDVVFYSTLGSSWEDAIDECFDQELAEESLRFFDAKDVPKVEGQIPPTVSEVHFRADLSSINPLEYEDLRHAGGLLEAVIPTT
jgi:hypothetical protein